MTTVGIEGLNGANTKTTSELCIDRML